MPDARLERAELRRALMTALEQLPLRFQRMLRLRYGFLAREEYTLYQIAMIDGAERGEPYSRENTRQHINNALRRLRYNFRAQDALRPWRPA